MNFEGPSQIKKVEKPAELEIIPVPELVAPEIPNPENPEVLQSVEVEEVKPEESVVERKEAQPENIVENVVEVTPAIRSNIEKIRKTLDKLNEDIQEYEKLCGSDIEELIKEEVNYHLPSDWENKDSDHDKLIRAIRHLRRTIEDDCGSFKPQFGFTYYNEWVPNIRPGTGFRGKSEREVKYLPETVEAAFLANDEDFFSKIREVALKIEKYQIISNYESKPSESWLLSNPSDFKKWESFLKLFDNIPRGNEDEIEEWLLAPATRVSYSIFSHVTSAVALDGILASGDLKSSNLAPGSSRTGAYSSSPNATSLEKSAIYFDQNSISLGYGSGGNQPHSLETDKYLKKDPRKIWFITRGDKLLNLCLPDRDTFLDKHPFMPGQNVYGSKFISPEKEGVEIPIDKFIILIPEGANDLKQKILKTYPSATIETYDKSYYSPGNRKEIDIKLIQNLSRELKDKFGSVEIPDIALSSLNSVEQTEGISMGFPLTVHLRSSEQEAQLQEAA